MRNFLYQLKKAKSFFFTVILLFTYQFITAQFITYPVPAQPITRGLDSTLLTVQISFPVCTGVAVTINLGATNSPGLIEYIPGSITVISGTGIITESDISNLSSPVFSVGNTSFGQTLKFSIKRRAFCGAAAASKDNILVTGTGANCNFSETNANINTYTLLAPAFTINPPAALLNVQVGNSYDRSIGIVNGGNGCADTVGFWIKYPAGSMQLNSLSFGATVLTPKFTNGDSSYYELTGSALGADNKLCNGETVALVENVKVLQCNVVTTYGAAGFDFSNSRCQVTTVVSGMSMSNALPSLGVTLAPSSVTLASCYVSAPRVMTYTVKNNGTGPATSISINTGNQVNNLPTANSYGYIDTASLLITVPGGAAFHPDASYYTGFTLINGTAGENNIACNQGKISDIKLALPSSIVLSSGDSVIIQYNMIYCPTTNSCDEVFIGTPQGTQVLYKNACGNTSYSTGNYVGANSRPFNNLSITSFEFPAQIRGGDCFDVTLSSNTTPANIISTRGYIEYELIIPAGVTFSAVNLIGVVAAPQSGYPRIVGNKVITRYNLNTGGNPVKFVFCTPNTLCANDILNATVTSSPDSACEIANPANINSVKRCTSSPISFVCTSPCSTGGIVPVYWKYSRKNYGSPDNNYNKLPDASGTVDPNIVYKDRYRPADTLHSEYRSYVIAQTAPLSIPNWNHINANWNFSKHIWAPAGTATVTIIRGGISTVVPGVAIATATYGKTFNVDFSQAPVALTALAPYQPNDSVIIEADFVLRDSLISTNAVSANVTVVDDGTRGKTFADAPDIALLTNNVYASTMANPAPADQASCFTPLYNANTLHLYNFSILNGNVLTGCTPARHEIRCYTRKLGGYTSNYFPGEYRQEFIPDSLVLIFPQGMTVVAGTQSVSGIYDNTPPTSTAVTNASILPYVSITGSSATSTTVVFDVQTALANNPSWKIQSEGTNYSFAIDARGSCATPNSFSIGGSQTAHVFQWPSPSSEAQFNDPGKIQSTSTFSNANKPNVNISSPDATSTPGSDTACWTIYLQNSSAQLAPINFIRINSNASFTNYVVKNGSTILTPNADGLIELSSINAGTTTTLSFCANTNSCALDSIKIESGWDCAVYPSGIDLINYGCWKTLWLKADPLQSQIQLSVDKQPASPDISLCTADNMIFKMNSALANYSDNPEFRVTVPVGMTISSGEIEYPDGSGNWQTVVPDTSAGVLVYHIEAHTGVNAGGLPGTISNPGTDNRAARLRLNYTTNCDFISGSKVSVQQRADRPCGSPIPTSLGFNSIVRANPINITGAGGPGNVGFDLTLSPATINTCGASSISGTVTPSGASTSTSDTIIVTLPNGIVYAGNLVSADGITVAAGYPVPGNGGTQILKLKVPDGITSGNQIAYSFDIKVSAVNFGCGKLNILSEMERTFAALSCGAITCPNSSKSIVGSAENIITVLKPDLSIVDLDYVAGDFSAGGSATVTITIDNNGEVDAPASSFNVEFFCGTSTVPFASTVFPLVINAFGSATTNLSINIPASPACENGQQVTAVVRPLTALNQEQCVCQETSRTILKILPVSLGSFTARQQNCTISLNWSSLVEINLKRFEVQYSTNGRSFASIGNIIGRGDNSNYTYSHLPAPGRAYYRLKMVDNSGESKYSSIIALNATCTGKNVLVYPNPANSILNVNLSGYPATVTCGLYNSTGQLVQTKQLLNGTNTINVNQLPAGVYALIISEQGNTRQVFKVQVTH